MRATGRQQRWTIIQYHRESDGARHRSVERIPRRPFCNAALACALLGLGLATGCFSERSIPMRPGDYVRIRLASHTDPDPGDTREWLRAAHEQLRHLLPPHDRPALLTDDLHDDDGHPRDVFSHFRLDPRGLHSVFGNYCGLLHSAQAAGRSSARPRAAWSGFRDVWIPVNDDLSIFGKLGFAGSDVNPPLADCVVLISGIFGDNNIRRTRDIAAALRGAGLHVLALELRGAGRTAARYPNVPYNFGAIEVGDLLAVSEWLESQPAIDRTGLIGYCWGANLALLAAWEDGRSAADPDVAARLRPHLRARNGRRHFTAGIMACSPILRFEEVIDRLDQRRWSVWDDPVLETLQNEVDRQAARKGYSDLGGSLRRLIERECARPPWAYPEYVRDGLRYLRLMPYRGHAVGPKLEAAREPVLILHAANDPLGPASDVADFGSTIENRFVAALVLPGGGHVGFIPYARAYTYSLMLDFFDPRCGAAAREAPPRRVARTLHPADQPGSGRADVPYRNRFKLGHAARSDVLSPEQR